jgi:hypothetical protein
MSIVTHVPFIKCYLSYKDNEKSVDTLINYLEKHNFLVKRRVKSDSKTLEDAFNAINNSEIFIAIVSEKYFESNALKEFDHAWDIKKPILCLFTSSVKSNNCKGIYDIMQKLVTYDLQKGVMSKNEWTNKELLAVLEKLNHIIQKNLNDQVKDRNQGKKTTLNTPDNFFVKDMTPNPDESEWANGLLGRGTMLDNDTILIVSKNDKSYFINLFDQKNFQLKRSIEAENLALEEPSLISVNTKSEIIIIDNKTGNLHFFNDNFNGLKKFDLNLIDFNDMAIDEDTNDVYLVKCIDQSRIMAFNYLTKKLKDIYLNSKQIDDKKFKPRFIRVVNNQIFIVNACSLRINKETREIQESTFGESLIYILDKTTLDVKNIIDFNKYAMCQPWSLIVDKDSNIYTTVSSINDKKFISKERYLCKLNNCGDLLESCSLRTDILPNDIFYLNPQFFLFKENYKFVYIFFEVVNQHQTEV